jgi:hypothetical protein
MLGHGWENYGPQVGFGAAIFSGPRFSARALFTVFSYAAILM